MIELTTPFSVGDADEHSYTHVRIQRTERSPIGKHLRVTAQHGYVDGGEWRPGICVPGKTVRNIVIANRVDADGNPDNQYDSLTARLTTNTGVPVFEEADRELEQFLVEQGHYDGTVVQGD